jgi:hypothetical protein
MYNSATEQTARMKAAYNYSQKEKENLRLKEEVKTRRIFFACVSVSLFLVILLLLSYIRHLKNKETLISMRRDLFLNPKRTERNTNTYEERLGEMKGRASYKRVIAVVDNPSWKMEQDDWQRLATDINNVWPEFDERLKRFCDMSAVQYRLCLLVMIKMAPTDMANLLNRSKSTVTSIRSRLYKKAFGEEKKPEDWDNAIRSL